MSFTETTSEGFFSRLGNSIGGIFVGILLILASSALLYWNEGNYVHQAAGLSEARRVVQEIKEDKVDSAQEGKLVHLTGTTKAGSALEDAAFGVSAKVIRMRRQVQFYEWVQKKESKKRKKLGGGEETTTTDTYEKKWVGQHEDSSSYKEKGHENPTPPDIQNKDFASSDSTIGTYKLQGPVLEALDNFDRLPLANVKVPADKTFRVTNDVLYQGKDPAAPQVGDVKVDFQVVKPGQISLVARQTGDRFDKYTTKADTTILLVEPGGHSAQEMLTHAEESNNMMTWVLRFVGWLLMCIGFSMLVGPINIVADIIPFLGDLVGLGTGLFGFAMGSSLSLVCIAIGWIFARPLVGILMLVGAIGIFIMLKKAGQK